ncbi:DUF1214 domain-containing protein [Cohaesibacter celericrescens]|uniref:DUF1214 domain-containing protein n=1 Tax=Cohaesibacter celericrescens TaxID=2067669 RepID=A0A2N5XR41_9HYPH|nr:DUF1214 domain-containing protein [Cohaesibacter celericrescens]PLW76969.1 hypothetical protein C0081_13065 [Cohaesibacter celericrescens]
MLLLRDIILFIVIAAGLGIGSAYVAVNNADRLELFEVGPWRAWPNASGPNANPYSKADHARKGALPFGSGEGLAFVAITDDNGTPLDGACQYRVHGTDLPTRLWTLSLITLNGKLVDNPSARYGFHSRNIARLGGSGYEIVTGPEAMGGNWLSSEVSSSFKLVLRLYETPLTSGGGFGEVRLPEIEWVSCE